MVRLDTVNGFVCVDGPSLCRQVELRLYLSNVEFPKSLQHGLGQGCSRLPDQQFGSLASIGRHTQLQACIMQGSLSRDDFQSC